MRGSAPGIKHQRGRSLHSCETSRGRAAQLGLPLVSKVKTRPHSFLNIRNERRVSFNQTAGKNNCLWIEKIEEVGDSFAQGFCQAGIGTLGSGIAGARQLIDPKSKRRIIAGIAWLAWISAGPRSRPGW